MILSQTNTLSKTYHYNFLESFLKSSITYKPSPSELTGSVWINAKREFDRTTWNMESRWNHDNGLVLDDSRIIDNLIIDPDVNNIKTCLTLLSARNNTNKFHLENVDCSSVKAIVICRADHIPTTTTTITTIKIPELTLNTRQPLPALPCITPLTRKKRQFNQNDISTEETKGLMF